MTKRSAGRVLVRLIFARPLPRAAGFV